MEEIKCEQVGVLVGDSWEKCHDTNRRVYSDKGLSPTITTMGGGQREPKIIEPRICAMRGRNPDKPSDRTAGNPTEQRLEIGSEETSNTLTTVQKDNLVVEPQGDRNDRNQTIREILCLLWEEVGEKAFCEWSIGGLWCILQTEILRQNLRAKSIAKSWEQRTEISSFTSYLAKDKRIDFTENDLREVWKKWKVRCSSYRRKLSKQQLRKFDGFVQELPYERTSCQVFVQGLWETCGRRNGLLQQALSEIQKIWKPLHNQEVQWNDYRIRKLTERECFRLQGVKGEDFEQVAKNQSTSALYHEAGDSICTSCLMAIFGQLFGVEYQTKINELVGELKS